MFRVPPVRCNGGQRGENIIIALILILLSFSFNSFIFTLFTSFSSLHKVAEFSIKWPKLLTEKTRENKVLLRSKIARLSWYLLWFQSFCTNYSKREAINKTLSWSQKAQKVMSKDYEIKFLSEREKDGCRIKSFHRNASQDMRYGRVIYPLTCTLTAMFLFTLSPTVRQGTKKWCL